MKLIKELSVKISKNTLKLLKTIEFSQERPKLKTWFLKRSTTYGIKS